MTTDQQSTRVQVLLIDPEGNQVAEAMMALPTDLSIPGDRVELPVSHEDAALIRAADSGSSMEGRRKAGEVMMRGLVASLTRPA